MTNNVLYVSDGDFGTPAGYLLPLMQGQFGQSVPLEIRDLSNNVVNLTGYTFTATKRKGSTVTAWVGSIVLSATPTAAPQVTLTVDEDDTGTDGGFDFFLEGTNGSQVLKTHPVSLTIIKDPAVNATAAPGLVGVTTAQKALLATISGLTGLVKMAGGVASAILIKLDGTAAPTVNDDSGDGFTVGSIWIDTTNDNAYIATDVTVGAANWVQINGAGAVDSVFGRTGAVVAASGDYAASKITDDSGFPGAGPAVSNTLGYLYGLLSALITSLSSHTGSTSNPHSVTAAQAGAQASSAKLTAIEALTWAANSIIWLTGPATASVQALAAHIVTLLQSASAADARTAIEAASTGANTFTGNQAVGNGLEYQINNTSATVAYAADANGANIKRGGLLLWSIGIGGVDSNGTANGPRMTNAAPTATAPSLIPGRADGNTGIGWIQADHMAIISGGKPSCGFAYLSGVVGSAVPVIPNGTGDVTLGLSGTFTCSDGAGGFDGGVIDPTTPGNNFNLFDDGGTNTCQLQVAADGSVTVVRTAGSRVYSVNLNLNWQ